MKVSVTKNALTKEQAKGQENQEVFSKGSWVQNGRDGLLPTD